MSVPLSNTNTRDAVTSREPLHSKRAVIYLRVSTAKQAAKDDDPDGYSLPAQEEACRRKAETLDAEVVSIFIDRGESARLPTGASSSACCASSRIRLTSTTSS